MRDYGIDCDLEPQPVITGDSRIVSRRRLTQPLLEVACNPQRLHADIKINVLRTMLLVYLLLQSVSTV